MTGTQRIAACFSQSKAFVAYLTAGDGGIKQTLAAALALIESGVTMLEIGVPFSDPIADGPVIQRAHARALAHGTTLAGCLDLVAEIRAKSDIPLILFTYLNPIFKVLHRDFFQNAKDAGIDGLLVVDCPLEEMAPMVQPCLQQGIAPILIATPTTTMQRVAALEQWGRGFLYYACRGGTTGVRAQLPHDFSDNIQQLKAHASLPVVVGFGIASREMAMEVLQQADGVVVGSLFVKAIENGMSMVNLKRLAQQINPLVRGVE